MHSTLEVEEIFYYSYGFNGYLDCICGVHDNIINKKINAVKFSKKDVFKLKNQYHPLIENPVKNNINMKKSKIITGPNAAGKTTILKSTVINLLLSQQIGYGYYDKGNLNPFQFIHCYINIPDTNDRDSLFQAEVRRCLDILEKIGSNSNLRHFCIFDELFSGTNPYEAISSAVSYLEYINKYNVKFILTTHYIQLCELMENNKKIINQNMKTDVKNNVSQYFYKMIKGISKIKGGLSVLKQLNYPEEIIKRSENIMENVR
jgi:DNA mismatch repair ATPase MutS